VALPLLLEDKPRPRTDTLLPAGMTAIGWHCPIPAPGIALTGAAPVKVTGTSCPEVPTPTWNAQLNASPADEVTITAIAAMSVDVDAMT